MPRRVKWTRRAEKDLSRLSKRDAARVSDAVERVVEDDLRGVEQLRGYVSVTHRLRVGHWRAPLKIVPGKVEVVRVLHRSKAYRKSASIHQAVPRDLGLPEHSAERTLNEGEAGVRTLGGD